MAFPTGWPPRFASTVRSIRFFVTGTATANFADRAYLFSQATGANTYTPMPNIRPGELTPVHVGDSSGGGSPMGSGPILAKTNLEGQSAVTPMIWCHTLRICNDGGADLEISFDGTNVHGLVKANEVFEDIDRWEAGIAVRGNGAVFRISAW